MKVKREKTNKRFMSIYHNAFGFRAPFQVIVDGTFLHQARLAGHVVKDRVESAVAGPASLMTSYCVYAELKKLGTDFKPTAAWAKTLPRIHKCNHNPAIPAKQCIRQIIGQQNTHRFCVATNDKNLRIELRKVTAVPLMYINKSVMILEPPSLITLKSQKELEIGKTAPKAFEVSLKPDLSIDEPLKKRKRKEPNSLSVKKTKKDVGAEFAEDKDGERVNKRRRKKRPVAITN